ETLIRLAQIYKQINAPVGELGLASLHISTKALESNEIGDVTYTALENQLISITTQRDALAAQMSKMLEKAAFDGKPINELQAILLIAQGKALLNSVNAIAI